VSWLAGVEGGRGAVEVGLGGSLVVFVLLGRRVEWSPRRVDGLAVQLGFVGVGVVGEVRRWADGVGAGGCVWGWACERRLWGGWALVPLVMGLPLKVACSEATIALGDAAACLSAGFSTQVGAVLARVAARVMQLVVLLLAAATP